MHDLRIPFFGCCSGPVLTVGSPRGGQLRILSMAEQCGRDIVSVRSGGGEGTPEIRGMVASGHGSRSPRFSQAS